jgi:hypothetical protein
MTDTNGPMPPSPPAMPLGPVPTAVSWAIYQVGPQVTCQVTFSTPLGASTYWYVEQDLNNLIRVLNQALERMGKTVLTAAALPPDQVGSARMRPPLPGKPPYFYERGR